MREDILLRYCRGGIVYLPGAAGTVQEVFQAATANYYSADPEQVCPMVFVGVEHWTSKLPVWPLISALGQDRTMGEAGRMSLGSRLGPPGVRRVGPGTGRVGWRARPRIRVGTPSPPSDRVAEPPRLTDFNVINA